MRDDTLYSFVFRGLLAEEALDKAGREPMAGYTEHWDAEMSRRLGLVLMDDFLVAKSRRMAVVYTAICAFENSVREFIEKKLLEENGEGWWELCVNPKIRTNAANRRKSEGGIRWLSARGDSLIYYTDFGDLVSIMAKDENWRLFEVHVVNIDWAKQIFTTLEKSRNIIMHSGELAETDIERVGMFIRDWIRQVG